MHINRKLFVVLSCALSLIAMGCAGTTAPSKWLPRPDQAQALAHGGWISVQYAEGRTKLQSHGELIAIHADSVFVLSVNSLKVIPKAKIKKATLTAYDANWGPLAAWSVLGTLSTASHGIGLIISAPVWILAGTIATSAQSYAPRITFPGKPWEEFRKYARFPNGLPPGLDRRALRSK